MKSADYKLIVSAYNYQNDRTLFEDKIWIMTDETEDPNDGKLFKKIPCICKILNIATMTSVDFVRKNNVEVHMPT